MNRSVLGLTLDTKSVKRAFVCSGNRVFVEWRPDGGGGGQWAVYLSDSARFTIYPFPLGAWPTKAAADKHARMIRNAMRATHVVLP